MKYFFVLGSNPALSIAEISSIFPEEAKNAEFIGEDILLIDIKNDIKPQELIKKMGGTIKIGVIKNEIPNNLEKIISESIDIININSTNQDGKFKFGISYYGKNKINALKIGLETKKHLKEEGINSRFVTSKEKNLSSVVVEQNKLITKGVEIILIENNNQLHIGKTLAVQPFKELSFRDYGRPARDDQSGMIPPKLAQIMINLSKTNCKKYCNASLLDPFCGSGTIITEAILMGYENLIGSDISAKAIEDTKKNIDWMKINYELQITNYKLLNISADKISNKISPNTINAIVTEPYLGPQRGRHDIPKTIKELKSLYSAALKEFKKILTAEGVIVMVWPVFRNKKYFDTISPDINGYKITNPIPENLRDNIDLKITDRNTIIYGRPNQKVWREIVILAKQK